MQTHPLRTHGSTSIRRTPWLAPRASPTRAAAGTVTAADRMFMSMLANYRASGGLARVAEVVACIERGLGKDAGQLERWRRDARVICFEWQSERWLPRFQFAGAGPLPSAAVALVLAELSTVCDEFEVAQWFATPNSSLGGRAPADAIGGQPAAVLEAARGDRFIADG